MITTIRSLQEQLDRRAERRRAYQALPLHRRAVETLKVKRMCIRAQLGLLRTRRRYGQPLHLWETTGLILKAVFIQGYE